MLLQQNNKCPVEDLNFIRYYITNIYYLCIIVGGDRKEPNMAAARRQYESAGGEKRCPIAFYM
jgi:hypothetical protein